MYQHVNQRGKVMKHGEALYQLLKNTLRSRSISHNRKKRIIRIAYRVCRLVLYVDKVSKIRAD